MNKYIKFCKVKVYPLELSLLPRFHSQNIAFDFFFLNVCEEAAQLFILERAIGNRIYDL